MRQPVLLVERQLGHRSPERSGPETAGRSRSRPFPRGASRISPSQAPLAHELRARGRIDEGGHAAEPRAPRAPPGRRAAPPAAWRCCASSSAAGRRSGPSRRRARRRARRPPAPNRRRWRAGRSRRAAWRAFASALSSKVSPSSRSSAVRRQLVDRRAARAPAPASSGHELAQLAAVAGGDDDLHGRRALERLALAGEQRLHRLAPPAPPARAYCSAENASFSAVA